ncbi:MAG: cell division protein SepF [Johnsonella sp.]|nr:cell division protein SepF [Johnsonella sp.]
MSILAKFIDKFRIDGTDFEDEDMEYYDDEEFETKPVKASPSRRVREESYIDEEPAEQSKIFSRSKVTPIRRSGNTNMEVVLVRPNSFEDSQQICDYLRAGKAVVLNMEGLHIELAQRVIDFSCGATYSIDGKLQKISRSIFIVTPKSVDLSGDFQSLLNPETSSRTSSSGLSGLSGMRYQH